jgi:hypothetical protein
VPAATRRYPEWVANTLAVTRADSESAAPGATYDERNRIIRPWHATSACACLGRRPPRRSRGTGIAIVK